MSTLRELTAIHDEFGELNAELVVKVATNPDHPLHSRFEWDDAIAGHKYRLSQASELLRVTYRPDPKKANDLRAFVAVRGENTPRAEYVPTEKAMSDPLQRQIVLRTMQREWQAFKARYEQMAEFADVIRHSLDAAA